MPPVRYKITLEQMKMAKKMLKKPYRNPCIPQIEKILNHFEAAEYDIRPIYKYVKEAEKCYEEAKIEARINRNRKNTLHYLSQYVDQRKNKRK